MAGEERDSSEILTPGSHPAAPAVRTFLAVARALAALLVWILLLCLLPVAVPVSLLFRIYRFLLKRHIWRKYSGRLQPIPGLEALWLQDSENNRTIIDAVLLITGDYDLEGLRKLVLDKAVNARTRDGSYQFERLRCRTRKILSCHVWEPIPDEQLDISDYVQMYEGRKPRDECELRRAISSLTSGDLPRGRAPWQLILIPTDMRDAATGTGKYALQFRLHHCMADGISLVKVLFSQFITTESLDGTESSPAVADAPESSTRTRYGARITWSTILNTAFYGPLLLLEQLLAPEDRHILHGPRPTGEKLVAWSEPVDLLWVKRIKNKCEATVNDVLVACVAGALSRCIRETGAEVPENMSAAVPVDVGSTSRREELRLENNLTVVPLKLPTAPSVRAESVVERVREVKRRMAWIKANPYHLINYVYTSYAMERFPDRVTSRIFDLISNLASMVLSNVPGPPERLRFMGSPVDMMIFWPPQRGNVCLGISIFSYSGCVRVGVQCDTAVMREPQSVCTEFNTQLALLSKRLMIPIPTTDLIPSDQQ